MDLEKKCAPEKTSRLFCLLLKFEEPLSVPVRRCPFPMAFWAIKLYLHADASFFLAFLLT